MLPQIHRNWVKLRVGSLIVMLALISKYMRRKQAEKQQQEKLDIDETALAQSGTDRGSQECTL